MTFCFLFFGYLGVPVAFSLLGGVMICAMFTDVSHPALIQHMFDGMDSAALVPPRITAVVYGALGNVSIAGLFMAGVVPGLMIGVGLMIYCYFFGPRGMTRPRAPFREVVFAFGDAALPLMIPVILLGGIL